MERNRRDRVKEENLNKNRKEWRWNNELKKSKENDDKDTEELYAKNYEKEWMTLRRNAKDNSKNDKKEET